VRFKVGDYVLFMERPGVLSRGWVDRISSDKESCDVQCDGGHGYRGLTVRCSYVMDVLPEKGRPLAYWKNKLCPSCKKPYDCGTPFGLHVSSECPYLTELVMAGAMKVGYP
jgi:hypothetical protein